MTELLFLNDAYVSEFDAVVTEITDDGGVVLDRSAFYIGGGGQPCDVGTLTDAASGTEYGVTKVARAGGAIVHSIDGEAKPEVGAALHGAIDWDRRYLLMRTHTALHILCGVVWRDYGTLVTGGDMRPGRRGWTSSWRICRRNSPRRWPPASTPRLRKGGTSGSVSWGGTRRTRIQT